MVAVMDGMFLTPSSILTTLENVFCIKDSTRDIYVEVLIGGIPVSSWWKIVLNIKKPPSSCLPGSWHWAGTQDSGRGALAFNFSYLSGVWWLRSFITFYLHRLPSFIRDPSGVSQRPDSFLSFTLEDPCNHSFFSSRFLSFMYFRHPCLFPP